MAIKKPDWWVYERTSKRVYVDAEPPFEGLPLLSNYPGESFSSKDSEPQRVVPLYLDFETGQLFFYEREALDLGAE